MADQKISELTALTGANVADDDAIAIVDTSATETKKIVFSELKNALDTATGFVRITGDTMTGALDVQSTITADGLTVDGAATITVTDNSDTLTLVSTDADASVGPVLNLFRNSASPADNDVLGRIVFKGEDSAGNDATFAIIEAIATDVTNGSEDGRIDFFAAKDDSFSAALSIAGQNVGIGTSSPSDNVEISTSADAKGLTIKNAGNNRPYLNFDANRSGAGNNLAQLNFKWNGTDVARIIAVAGSDTTNKDDGHITFNTSSAGSVDEAMRISSDGSVGINDSSPDGKLNVVSTAHNNGSIFDSTGTTQLWLRDTDASSNQKNWGFQVSGGSLNILRANDDRASGFVTPIEIKQAPANSLVLDASGNLLVGKTSTAFGTDGTHINNGGYLEVTNTSGELLYLNRLSNDGDLIRLFKDSAQVGSIKVKSDRLAITDNTYGGIVFANGGNGVLPSVNDGTPTNNSIDLGNSAFGWKDLYLSGGVKWTEGQVEINSGRLLQRSTGDAAGLRFDGSGYTPFKNGSVADGTVDLGYSAGRYNNLYLSGGVYLGGTGSANKLEDYEEGTWTPANGNFSTYSSPTWIARYRKIGSVVHLYLRQTGGTVSWTNQQYLTGLPFGVELVGNGIVADTGPNNDATWAMVWINNRLYFQGAKTETDLVLSFTYTTGS